MKFRLLLLAALFVCLPLFDSSAQITTNGLVGYWPLNGNANDASGNGHDGVINGASAVAGKFDGAYHFDGSATIDVGDFGFSNQQYTVSGWIRTTEPAVTEDWRTWIDKLDNNPGPSNGGPFMLGIGDGRAVAGSNGVQYAVWTGGSTSVNILDTQSNLRDGVWHLVVTTYQPGAQNAYVDGLLVGSASFAGPLPVNTTHVLIGGHDFGPFHHPWKGDIDEVRIYNRALTAQEIQGLYNPALLSIFPGSGTLVEPQTFDLSLILQNTTSAVASAQLTFDGQDYTAFFIKHLRNGFVQNGRFSLIKDLGLEEGTHTLDVRIELADHTVLTQSVTWIVLDETHPGKHK